MPNSVRRIDVAGRDVTEHLQTLLRKAGYIFHTSAEKEVVRDIKEKTCYVALDGPKEEKEWAASGSRAEGKSKEYTLPDGQKLKVREMTKIPKQMNHTSQLILTLLLPRLYRFSGS